MQKLLRSRKTIIVTAIATCLFIAVVELAVAKALHLHSLLFNPGDHRAVFYQNEVLQLTRRSQQTQNIVAFFGDSNMTGLATSNLTPRSENYSVPGEVIEGLVDNIPNFDLSGVRMIVLAIGTNDWGRNRYGTVEEYYRKLLHMLPQNIPVIVNSISPVNHKNNFSMAFPENVRAINLKVEAICKEFPNCRFVDIASLLSDKDGFLAPQYDVGDGLHLSTAAYAVWTKALLPYMPK